MSVGIAPVRRAKIDIGGSTVKVLPFTLERGVPPSLTCAVSQSESRKLIKAFVYPIHISLWKELDDLANGATPFDLMFYFALKYIDKICSSYSKFAPWYRRTKLN